MSNIQLMDWPAFVDSKETEIGALVRTWTAQKLVHAANYLNFYARKVLPYTRWGGAVDIKDFTFVYPVDTPSYSYRWLTVLFGVRDNQSDSVGEVKVTAKSTGDYQTITVASGLAATSDWADGSENGVTYHIATVKITAGRQEMITVEGSSGDVIFEGFGAWELPPKAGGAEPAASGLGGHQLALASIASSISGVVDPQDFSPADLVNTDLSDIQSALRSAWIANRRIIFNGGVGDPGVGGNMDLHTDSPNNQGDFVLVPTGGIYIPPYCVPDAEDDYRMIRVAVYVQNEGSAADASYWHVETSYGSYGSDNWTGTTPQWRPMGPPATFDTTVDGVQAKVSNAGEWIYIGLYDNEETASDPHAHQVIIWEDDPEVP